MGAPKTVKKSTPGLIPSRAWPSSFGRSFCSHGLGLRHRCDRGRRLLAPTFDRQQCCIMLICEVAASRSKHQRSVLVSSTAAEGLVQKAAMRRTLARREVVASCFVGRCGKLFGSAGRML